MLCVCYVNILFSLYSVVAVLSNVSPIATLKGVDFAKSIRSSGRKKEIREDDKAIIFDNTEDEVLVNIGETVTLQCAVKNLGNNIVSWIRCKNLRVITTGAIVFTTHKRFHLNSGFSDTDFESWNLTISRVELNDNGIYECQINTEPKLKRYVLLMVNSDNKLEQLQSMNEITRDLQMDFQSATSLIVGPAEQFVSVGGSVTFTCYISIELKNDTTTAEKIGPHQFDDQFVHFSSRIVRKIYWFHSTTLITAQMSKEGTIIDTQIYSPNSTVSRLTISRVESRHAGFYSCQSIGGPASNVVLHVMKDEEIEAVKPENYLQFNNATKNDTVATTKYQRLFLLLYIFSIYRYSFSILK